MTEKLAAHPIQWRVLAFWSDNSSQGAGSPASVAFSPAFQYPQAAEGAESAFQLPIPVASPCRSSPFPRNQSTRVSECTGAYPKLSLDLFYFRNAQEEAHRCGRSTSAI